MSHLLNTTQTKTYFLFDLDGVIIDSERKYTEIWTHINELFPTGKENLALSIKGMTLENILSTHYPDKNTQRDVEKKLWQMESEMIYDCCPGIPLFLGKIKSLHIPTALVTSSNALKLEHLWQQMPWLKKCFDVIVDGDMVSRGKPAPDCYNAAIVSLKAIPEQCVVFEDSLQGVKAGKNAGCKVIGITGTVSEEKLREYADTIIDDFSDYSPEQFIINDNNFKS